MVSILGIDGWWFGWGFLLVFVHFFCRLVSCVLRVLGSGRFTFLCQVCLVVVYGITLLFWFTCGYYMFVCRVFECLGGFGVLSIHFIVFIVFVIFVVCVGWFLGEWWFYYL